MMPVVTFAQGTTTSSSSGQITDEAGSALIGATVQATHVPTGTVYGVATDLNGNYRISNMRVGGPYTFVIRYTGSTTQEVTGIQLLLGETGRYDFTLTETALQLETVTVTAQAGSVGSSSGASTQIRAADISNLPSIERGIYDFVRTSPQVSLYGGGVSVAGTNNRFNAIYIDGAVNNDVFGLASSGTNGGQTGISPFSLDIIDQLQVVVSPYDVTLGGFAGGGINAVTRSGTNKYTASAYRYIQNQTLVGKTNQVLSDRLDIERERVNDFTQNQYGLTIGGPIIQDKMFFFVNAELQRDDTPRPFNPAEYTSVVGRASIADLENLRNHVISNYNYDPGTFGDTQGALEGNKLFAKIDYNINQDHRLTLRHQYTKAEQFNRLASNSSRINFSNNGIYFPSTTNSSAVELNSVLGNQYSNSLILSYVRVRDNRRWLSDPFPYVIINDAGGRIEFGTEPFSTANQLDQDIIALTNNFQIFRGNHTITVGTHNEFYNIYNLFIPQNFGQYTYANLNAFLTDARPSGYSRGYSLVDNITGPGSAAAADFSAIQLGFYVQDEWMVSSQLMLSLGLRLDIPIITSSPADDGFVNSSALPQIANFYSIANETTGGSAPDGQLMFSPRIGFTYSTYNDMDLKIRGGAGIFTSRIPFVWPGAMFNENGVTRGNVNLGNLAGQTVTFRPDYQNQYVHPNISLPQGDLSLFTDDFKYPQVFRTNVATDFMLPFGIQTTLEAIYTKTINNLYYTNINSDPTVSFRWRGTPDGREVYTGGKIVSQYNGVYLASNTSEGYGYNLSASFAKMFDFGLNASLAYSYGDSYALAENTSSQNSSQWRGQVHVNGRNNPAFGRSDFAAGHRVISALNYRHDFTGTGNFGTTFSIFMNAQSGNPYSYVFGQNNVNAENGSTGRQRTLVYIPATAADINLVDIVSGGNVVRTAAQQWENLDKYISDSDYLSSRRGQYAEKNGAFAPFTSIFDFGIRQDVGLVAGGQRHRMQISVDIMNVGNIVNSEWGAQYTIPGSNNNYTLINFVGYEGDGSTPRFTYTGANTGDDAFGISGLLSRWRMQFGVRYLFN